METLKDFVKEVNRWLKVRWKAADFVREFPTSYDAASYIRRQLEEVVKTYGFEARKLDDEWREKNGYPATEASIEVRTVLDVKVDLADVENPTTYIRIVTGYGTQERTIVAFRLVVKYYEMDENDKCNAVKSISCDDGEKSLLSILTDACALQNSMDCDINERWMQASDDFREKHLICPVCQANAMVYSRGGSGDVPMGCSSCGWTSRYKGYYNSDFAEVDVFKREISEHAREVKYAENIRLGFETSREGLQQLKAAFSKRPNKKSKRMDLLIGLNNLIGEIEKFRDEVGDSGK